MELVLNEPAKTVNSVFASVSITAPILGCIFGGSVANYYGGYDSDKSLNICLIYCICACLAASPIPFLKIFWLVSVLIWFLLFFGGALVPSLTGNEGAEKIV